MSERMNGAQVGQATVDKPLRAWTVPRVALAALITLGIGFLFFLLYQLYMAVFLFFVGITLAVAIRPAVDWLEARRVNEGTGVLIVYALLLVILIGFASLVGPLVVKQTNALMTQLPEYYQQLRTAMTNSNSRLLVQIVHALPTVSTLPREVIPQETTAFDAIIPAWRFIKTASYAIFVAGAIVMLAFYWTLEEDLITRRMILLMPSNLREEARSLLVEMEATIGSYFRGQAILCVIVGLLSLIGYWSIGLAYALGLALIMTVCEAIPMIGPTLGAIPAVLVALSTAPGQVPWVLGTVVVIQVLEGNVLVPRVMNESVGVNPIITILGIAAFGALFGLGGAILAIPLAAMLQIVLNHLFFRASGQDEWLLVEQKADNPDRSVASKIRLQTQELIADLQKGMRSEEDESEPEIDDAQEMLEAIASDLERLLRRTEQTA